MWAPTLSFPSPIPANCGTHKRLNLRLRASVSNYPLASRIFVKNLPYSTKESSLQKEFANFGQIAEVKLVKDDFTKRSKGYAFIQYTSQNDAMLAIENMDKQKYRDSPLYMTKSSFSVNSTTVYNFISSYHLNSRTMVFDGRLIYVEIAKPGKDRFKEYPKTSGPPRSKQHLQETDDVADCWY
ncbi:hypothetical protein CRYUN_Cryun10bG0170900 [Craigia yunnanensis]